MDSPRTDALATAPGWPTRAAAAVRGLFTGRSKRQPKSSPELEALSGPGVVRAAPLWEQHQRIGGGLTPLGASQIFQEADRGRPGRMVSLFRESRNRDLHLFSICETRESEVVLTDLDFAIPKNADQASQETAELYRRIVAEFENWQELIGHLVGSYLWGHATAEILWRKTPDGFVLPYKAKPIQQSEFVFTLDSGELRYAMSPSDLVGIDVADLYPGRVVQVKRRITGAPLHMEGAGRALIWAALFRNWSLRDWLALGEVAWKPWRIGTYERGTLEAEIDQLVSTLQQIGSSGVGIVPSNCGISVEWPKNGLSSGSSVHRELFDVLGREMSKAVLGTTTSVESGPNGDRASTETRDDMRSMRARADAACVAGALKSQLFDVAAAVNLARPSAAVRPVFMLDDLSDLESVGRAAVSLANSGLRVPAAWLRAQGGIPEPEDGDELLSATPAAVSAPPNDPEDDPEDGGEKSGRGGVEQKGIASDLGMPTNNLEYVDRLTEAGRVAAVKDLSQFLASVLAAVSDAGSYDEARSAVLRAYRGSEPPTNLARIVESALLLSQAAGSLGVLEEIPELGAKT